MVTGSLDRLRRGVASAEVLALGSFVVSTTLALGSFVASTTLAQAPHLRARLDLEGTGCLDAAEVARGVEARLERPVFVEEPDAALLSIRVSEEADDVLAVTVTLARDGHVIGTRVIRGTCASIVRATPIVVALTVDLEASVVTIHEPVPEAAATPDPEPRPRSEVASTSPARPTGSRAAEPAAVRGGVRAGVAVMLGLFPEPWLSTIVAGRLEPVQGLVVELRAELVPPFEVVRGDEHVTTWAAGGGAALCWAGGDRVLGVELCGLGRGGAFQAAGRGFTMDLSAWGAFAELAASARGALRPLPLLELGLELELGAPLLAPRFAVAQLGGGERDLASGGPVSGRVGFTIGMVSP